MADRQKENQQAEDRRIMGRINEMVEEEHELRHRRGGLGSPQRERLRSLEVELDRCWDLLRQRRALREAGEDADEAAARDEKTVEGYLQ